MCVERHAVNCALASKSGEMDTKRRVYLERHVSDVTRVNTALATLGRVHFALVTIATMPPLVHNVLFLALKTKKKIIRRYEGIYYGHFLPHDIQRWKSLTRELSIGHPSPLHLDVQNEKHLHSGLKVIEVTSVLAAAVFNKGNTALQMLINKLEVVVGMRSFNYGQQMDEQRVKRKNNRSALET